MYGAKYKLKYSFPAVRLIANIPACSFRKIQVLILIFITYYKNKYC